jgi:dipeptidyl aminopeptidase/acylaminoacyl peptidase
MVQPTFIQINTTDDFTLPGLLYEPKIKKAAAIYLHGNGSSSVFYRDDQRNEWAQSFAKQNIALLVFNNRGAHLIKSLHYKKAGKDCKTYGGMAYEKIRDCVPDIDGAITTFYDIANPDGDYNVFPFYEVLRKVKLSRRPLFRYFKKIKKPALVVYGGEDEYCWNNVPGVVKILQDLKPEFFYKIISNADHGFNGYQKQLAKIMTLWITHLQN